MCRECKQIPCCVMCPNSTLQEIIYCQRCGKQLCDTAYFSNSGDFLGCDNCVTVRNLYEK